MVAGGSVLNRSALRKFIFAKLEALRPHLNFKRVSGKAFQRYEVMLRNAVERDIRSHPTIGKTFNPGE